MRSSDIHQRVIELAKKAHALHWRMGEDVGTADRMAASVTAEWQKSVLNEFPNQFLAEHRVADHLGERIDLVDVKRGIAYELKVSPNNDHFEFYRDIFKVLIAKDHALSSLKSFCFVCPDVAARRYVRGLRRAVLDEGPRLGLQLSVESI
jgi:hypothetical protein